MKPNLTQAEVNHLRKLLGWVRCEVGQTPEEIVSTMQQLAPKLPDPDTEAKARLVEYHAQAAAVPKYVRAAVKALEKLLIKQTGVVVDVDPGGAGAELGSLPAPPFALTPPIPWEDEPPITPGAYYFRCMENDNVPELLMVDIGRNSLLIVECPHLGPTIVSCYHDGLTNPLWQKVEGAPHASN